MDLKDIDGIASMTLPADFAKTSEDRDFGHFMEYRTDSSRICYWEKDNYFASDEVATRLSLILQESPHQILEKDPEDPYNLKADEDEYFCAAEALLQPGRVLPPFGFDISSMRTHELNGKNVFLVDFDMEDRFVSIVIWDADQKAGTLQHLWIEGPKQEEEAVRKTFSDTCSSISWLGS